MSRLTRCLQDYKEYKEDCSTVLDHQQKETHNMTNPVKTFFDNPKLVCPQSSFSDIFGETPSQDQDNDVLRHQTWNFLCKSNAISSPTSPKHYLCNIPKLVSPDKDEFPSKEISQCSSRSAKLNQDEFKTEEELWDEFTRSRLASSTERTSDALSNANTRHLEKSSGYSRSGGSLLIPDETYPNRKSLDLSSRDTLEKVPKLNSDVQTESLLSASENSPHSNILKSEEISLPLPFSHQKYINLLKDLKLTDLELERINTGSEGENSEFPSNKEGVKSVGNSNQGERSPQPQHNKQAEQLSLPGLQQGSPNIFQNSQSFPEPLGRQPGPLPLLYVQPPITHYSNYRMVRYPYFTNAGPQLQIPRLAPPVPTVAGGSKRDTLKNNVGQMSENITPELKETKGFSPGRNGVRVYKRFPPYPMVSHPVFYTERD